MSVVGVLLWIGLLHSWAHCQDPTLPHISVQPTGGIFKDGSPPIALECVAEDADNIQWAHNGAIVSSEPSRTIGSDNVLTIVSLSGDLAGSYTCLASNEVGTVTSAIAEIELAVLQRSFHSVDANNPHEVVLTKGVPSAIDCGSVTSVPPASISWIIYDGFDGIDINPVVDMAIEGLDGRLYFQNPGNSLNGETFECSAENRIVGSTEYGYVRVTVEDPSPPEADEQPQLLSTPQDVTVNSAETTAEFDCIVGGTPLPPDVEWMYPSSLDGDSRLRLSQNNAVLTVRNVQASDAGQYSCTTVGIDTFTATLTLRDPPTISTPLPSSTQEIEYGNTLTLSCSASGLDITWLWYHNGVQITEALESILVISGAVEEDSGIYQCFAYNPAGYDNSAALVTVNTIAPVFTTEGELPSSLVAFETKSFQFTCEATGAPPPDYNWMKDGIPLGSDNIGFTFPSPGALQITEVSSTHSGEYTCEAVNEVDGQTIGSVETSATLTVLAPTVITDSLPPSYSIQLDTPVTLPCEVESDPRTQLQFSWTKNGSPLVVPSTRLVFEGTSGNLHIYQPENEDSGIYVCVVMTTYNGIEAPTVSSDPSNLTVTATPIGPTIITIDTVNSTAVKIQWYFPGDSMRVVSYSIEIQTIGAEEWVEVATKTAQAVTEATIGGLVPFTRYDVRVVANYANGDSVPSDVYRKSETEGESVLTAEDNPGTPPGDVNVVVASHTSLLVSWEPPTEPNGVITLYTLQYRVTGSEEWNEISVPGTSTNYTLTDLLSKTNYDIRMAAHTSAGIGPFSEGTTIMVDITGGLQESESTSFHETTWFLLLMFLIVLGMVVAVVIVVCVVVKKKWLRKGGTYQVRPASGYYTPTADDISLSEEVVMDYESRARKEVYAFGSAKALDSLEVESSTVDGSIMYGTPQLSGSSALRLGQHAPAYINPPPFDEALKSRSRTHSAQSSSTVDKPEFTESEWSMEHGSKDALALSNPDYHHHHGEYNYEEESDSIEKPSYTSSDVSDGIAEQQERVQTSSSVNYATFV